MDDARRWAELYKQRMSILKIAKAEGVDPGTVSSWLAKIGIEVKQGEHFVRQPPLQIPDDLARLLLDGPNEVRRFVEAKVWGIQASQEGQEQLTNFCNFISLHKSGKGVEEIARELAIHRSTVLQWRNGTDEPYLVKMARVALKNPGPEGWMLAPLLIESGGNEPRQWKHVPRKIGGYRDLAQLVAGLTPLEKAYTRAARFGLRREEVNALTEDFFAYVLGIMLGDAGKPGGVQQRFTSMNLDLQFSQKEPTNEGLGEFVCMCVNSIGIKMKAAADKMPSGTTAFAEVPMPAFRWISGRSAIIAWMFVVGLGLRPNELTSVDHVKMPWILDAPTHFLKRFVQGLADSDGTVRRYLVEIASMPNAEFVTQVLHRLGMTTARTMYEKGVPTRTSVLNREAASLPIFNEFVKGYRYQLLMQRV